MAIEIKEYLGAKPKVVKNTKTTKKNTATKQTKNQTTKQTLSR